MDLKLYVDSDFEGVDKDGLKQLAKGAGIKLPPNPGEAWLKSALRAAASGGEVAAEPTNVTPISNAMPNLTPFGPWGGRKHYVTALNNAGDPNLKGVTVHWEGRPCDLLFGVKKEVGEPWYNVMKTQHNAHTVCRTVTEADGTKRIVAEDRPYRVISFEYGGLVPGTEQLPGSLLEYYQRLAREKQNFARYKRRPLLRILSELSPEIGETRTEKMTDSDLRYHILKFLGPDFTMDESEEHDEEVVA